VSATDPHQVLHRTIEAVWRIESARVIAGLTRLTRDVGLAEDLAQEALLVALEQWPRTGVPENPGAWLTATAKHRAIDLFRRHAVAELVVGNPLHMSGDASPQAARAQQFAESLRAEFHLPVHLVDERTGTVLGRLYPQDKTQNASGLRRSLDPIANGSATPMPTDVEPATGPPPLLARMLDQQAASGLPPAYLPKDEEGETP